MRNLRYIFIWLAIVALLMALYPWAEKNPRHLDWMHTAILMVMLFFSVVIHELSHGLAARACGDDTAEKAGRLTLNPISHVSMFGSLILPFVLHLLAAPVFGWAKPVPFNPVNLKSYPRDQVWIAMAGPLSNLSLSFASYLTYLVSALGFKMMNPGHPLHFSLDIIAPLDFSGVGFEAIWFVWFELLAFGTIINLILAVFNLLPFPPLDGSWILKALLPSKMAGIFSKIQLFGFVLIIIAVHFNLLSVFMYPLMIVIGGYDIIGNWTLQGLP